MPYNHLRDLPENVRHVLPLHAQEIYLAAFNSAFDEYEEPKKRASTETREEVSHKVAWSAVKKKYVKDKDGWKERDAKGK